MGSRLVVEPDIIVQLNVKAAKWIGGRSAVLIEIVKVGGVDGVTRQETRWKRGNAAGVEL